MTIVQILQQELMFIPTGENAGCPIDSDGDGVPDYIDNCDVVIDLQVMDDQQQMELVKMLENVCAIAEANDHWMPVVQ